MLLDNNNDNLLSTFGKDSQSSNRKNSSSIKQGVKNKRTCLNYHDTIIQPRNKYEQILNQRKTLMLMQKRSVLPLRNDNNNKVDSINKKMNNHIEKQQSKKKLKTQTDIDYLNKKIRNSISGIAQTICKSKIKLQSNRKKEQLCNQSQQQQRQRQLKVQSFKQLNHNYKQNNKFSSNKNLYNQRLRSSRCEYRDKENVSSLLNRNNSKSNCNKVNSINNNKFNSRLNQTKICNSVNVYQDNNYSNKNNNNNILKNSTKKKARFFQSSQTDNNNNNNNNNKQFNTGILSNNNNNNRHHHQYNHHSRQQSVSSSNRLYTQPISSTSTSSLAYNWCSRFDVAYNDSNRNSIRKQHLQKQQKQQQSSYRLSLQSQRQQKRQQNYSQSLNKLKQRKQQKLNNNNNIEDTLKKQSPKQLLMLVESSYIQLPKLVNSGSNNNLNNKNNNNLKNNYNNSNKFTTRTTMSSCNGRDSDRNHYYHQFSQQQNNNLSYQNNHLSYQNNHLSYQNNNLYHNNNNIFYQSKHNNHHHRQPTLQSQHLFSQSQFQHQTTQQQNNQQQQQQIQNSPNFANIQVPNKILSLYDIKKHIKLYNKQEQVKKQKHPLIKALMEQIQLDYDLRHAKHMFSGIEEPFVTTTRFDINNKSINKQSSSSSSKWHILNTQLNSRGLNYSVQTIKKLFLPTQQQLDPFLSVTQPHNQLIHSLIYAYQTAQIHWQQTIYKKWQHWDLRQIQLTIQNIDRERKGYITVEDIAAFVSMQSGNQYKNRDVILIYKRLLSMGDGFINTNDISNNFNSQDISLINKNSSKRLKFRSLIDCLIRNF